VGHEGDAQVEVAEPERRAGIERRGAGDQLGAARGAVQQRETAEVRAVSREGLDGTLQGAPIHDGRGGAGGRERERTQTVHHAGVVDTRALGVVGARGVNAGLGCGAIVVADTGGGGDAAASHPALSGVGAAGLGLTLHLDRQVELHEGRLRGPARGCTLEPGHEIGGTVADTVVWVWTRAGLRAGAVPVIGAGGCQADRAVPKATLAARTLRVLRARGRGRDAAVTDLADRL